MSGSEWSKREHWTTATVEAFESLAKNFPAENIFFGSDAVVWGELTTRCFPCQKSDVSEKCPGWSLGPPPRFAAPGQARPCPCVCGRGLQFGPLLSLASEFAGGNGAASLEVVQLKSSFFHADTRQQLFSLALSWMWMAARMGFAPTQDGGLIEQVRVSDLTVPQRQSLRWWTRLIELNALVQNNIFTVLTQTSLEKVYRQRGVVSLRTLVDNLALDEQQIVVLLFTGDELTPAGFHSEKHAWLDSFLNMVDEGMLALSIASCQPLFSNQSPDSGRISAEFRWKARHRVDGAQFSIQQSLRKGTWDRLCESLARADALLRARGLLRVNE